MLEDSILIAKLKAGDAAAFSDLVSAYRSRVINTCYRFLLNKEDAEDISQELFVEVYRSVSSFRGESKLSTWILRIAVAKSLDEIKKRKRKKRLTSVFKMALLDDIVHLLAGGASPEKQLSGKENRNEILAAMDALPDNQRIAFTLSKVEGYTNTEIAEIMSVTTVAVESLIYRAKKQLVVELKDIFKNI